MAEEARRRSGRIVGTPPQLANVKLARYSTGLFNGEGYSYNKRRRRKFGFSITPTIVITMCDRDALVPAGEWWGLPVRKRGGRKRTCVDGQAYRVESLGLRARLLIQAMIENGLSARSRTQWEKVLREHERNAGFVPR
jgi:hypothetical protein